MDIEENVQPVIQSGPNKDIKLIISKDTKVVISAIFHTDNSDNYTMVAACSKDMLHVESKSPRLFIDKCMSTLMKAYKDITDLHS